ncbi:MAG: hypothetical protein IMY67_09855 [Bacteroidetes bacterium]|nr:hypothetical protein [Bacteroidota bacterium]
MKIRKIQITILIFWLMILVYSFFSSMMPRSFGIAELFVGVVLIYLSINATTVNYLIMPDKNILRVTPPSYIKKAFLFFLVVPLMVGFIRQNDILDIIRDIIPLMFLFMPLFFYSRIKANSVYWYKGFVYALAFIGIAMTIRHFFDSDNTIDDLGEKLILGGKISLAHDPAVLFSAIFFSGMGFHKLFRGNLLTACVFMSLSVIPLSAIFAVAARAPLGLYIVALLLLSYLNSSSNKVAAYLSPFVFGALILVVFYIFGEVITKSVDMMLLKHETYGVSSRDIELLAVSELVTNNIYNFFLGIGWGGLILNPIGGVGASWSFVHNMFAYFLFKSGVIGLFFIFLYFYWIIKCCIQAFLVFKKSSNEVIIGLIAAVPPVLINSLLEVGYKTITFGLLITLIVIIYLMSKSSYLDSQS